MYIISSCLLGNNCKYNGGNNRCEAVIRFCAAHDYVVVCPESAGKLPCPRPPAERKGDRIIDRTGKDVTENFEEGAAVSLAACLQAAAQRDVPIEGAILKANSPSCGSGQIYDGSFSGKLIPGDGIFTAKLKRRRIPVITEKETQTMTEWMGHTRKPCENEGERHD